jgi:hypothetical protein
MYFLAGHRNYSFVLTKASAVDKLSILDICSITFLMELKRLYIRMI